MAPTDQALEDLQASLPAAPELEHAAGLMRLLADRTRLALLTLLDGSELSVGQLADCLDRPVPAVSQHLAKLRAGRLVTTRRDGATVYYSQPNEHVAALVTNILHLSEHALYETPPHHSRPEQITGH